MNRLIDILTGFALAAVVANALIALQIIDCRVHREPLPPVLPTIDDHPLFMPCDGFPAPPPPLPSLEGSH